MKKVFFLLVALTVGICASYAQATSLYILFPANSANLERVSTEQAIENNRVFTEVAKVLSENPQQRVLVDGHANPVAGTPLEEARILTSLSRQRAEVSAEFLAKYYNIDRRRIIVSSAGGSLAGTGSGGNHLNRRVNFFIVDPR